MAKDKTDKKSSEIDEVVKDLKKRYGEGSIMTLGESRRVDVEAISTGSPSLDLALGVFGLPRGRVVEIFGPESSGKTTLALSVVAQAQKQGGMAAYVDVEHALDPEYAKKIGVDIEKLLISQPDSGEQALNIVESLIRTGEIDAIVIDSVAALTPQAELEGEIDEQQIGLQARLMSKALRKLTALVDKTGTVVIFINQIRMKIGIMFGNPETTPGGMALKFAAAARIDLRRVGQIKKGEEVIGSRIKAKVVKNKVAAPFKTAEFDIIYNQGINYELDLLNAGLKYEVLKKSGNTLYFGETRLGGSLDASREFLAQNPNVAKEIFEKLKEVKA